MNGTNNIAWFSINHGTKTCYGCRVPMGRLLDFYSIIMVGNDNAATRLI